MCARAYARGYNRVYQAINARLRTFAGGRWRNHCRPGSIALLLTERCNARCVHCDIWKNRGKEDGPGLEGWKVVLGDLRRWLGPVTVTITGGEALLVPFAPELVAHGVRLGLLMENLTHGFWLDQSRIERLALADPWRITISLDGLGQTHSKVRGRENFFEAVEESIRTLQSLRRRHGLGFRTRLKTVIMEHNLDELAEIARFAASLKATDVFYQPIEQNYNTPDDPRWFEHSPNWPKDAEKAVRAVQQLVELKRQGLPIGNTEHQLEVMIPYFRDPDSMRVLTQAHSAHDRPVCAALGMLQLQSNGDVTICSSKGPVGNVKEAPIRQIWEGRPRFWEKGCCFEERMSEAEKRATHLEEVLHHDLVNIS